MRRRVRSGAESPLRIARNGATLAGTQNQGAFEMKKLVVVGLIGLAVGLVMPDVLAQAPQAAEVQLREQFCEEYVGSKKAVSKGSQSAAAHGKKGYQLVSSSLQRQ
jgi:hypothetical protein